MPDVQRVAIITGGGTGIGAEAARQFGAQGTTAVVIGRRPAPLHDIVQAIKTGGGEALAIPGDLADPDFPARIVSETVAAFGRIDILVNNAAAIDHKPIERATRELFDLHMAVNVRAPYLLIQAALPHLRESESGVIINISSSSGSLAIPGQSMYGTSKAALEYLTKSLAAELAPQVRVNCIAPGPVDTPIHLTWAGDDVEGAYARMTSELPLGRMGTAQELGSWITWLAGPEASFVTGVVIPVDGGQVLPGAMSRIAQ
jgi:NAD(P)-dependent dehydrogenase (short-subunit alcohol dehydrogenase family)